MVDYEYRDLFHTGSVEKQLHIRCGGDTLDNEDLECDTMVLTQTICDKEELCFGCCSSSQFQITALNYGNSLAGQEISVWLDLAGADKPFPLGIYTVHTDQESADGQHRNIVAYDALSSVFKANMAEWYNGLTFPMTLRAFRDAFLSHFNITQDPVVLVNDEMIIEKTIDPSEISGKDVLSSICEINGCFGRINHHGNFQYVTLQENIPGLYPAEDLYPADDLYPREKNYTSIDQGEYFTCTYEKTVSQRITKLRIRQEEHDIGITVGDGTNSYVVEDNFLVYGKGTEELTAIANNLLGVISQASYQPYTLEAVGDPCIEPGDCIRIPIDGGEVVSYVLKRVLKGIQMLDDTYSATGKEYHSDDANHPAKSIKQLKGKMNKIEHTIEMTRLEISDLEKGMSSRITQTAEQISTEVTRAQKAEQDLAGSISSVNTTMSSRFTQTAEQISTEVTRAQKAEQDLAGSISSVNTTMLSRFTQTAEQISTEVTRAQKAEQDLAGSISSVNTTMLSRFTQTAEQISTEVTRAQKAEQNLAGSIDSVSTTMSSRFTQTAEQISLKVTKGEVSSEITQEAGKVAISSNRFSLNSTNTKITEDGTIEAKNIRITGGSVNISTDSNSYDVIRLFNSRGYCGVDSYGICVSSVTLGRTTVDAAGICVYDTTISTNRSSRMDWRGAHINELWSSTLDEIDVMHKLNCRDDVKIIAGHSLTIASNTEINTNTAKFFNTEFNASYAKIGAINTILGFFGSSGSAKRSVSKVSNTTSATAASIATTLNNLIDALKAYNLIG